MKEPRKPSRTTKSNNSKSRPTTGQQTRSGWDDLPTLSPDDPIFNRGFVIGRKLSTLSSATTPAPPSPSENDKLMKKASPPPEPTGQTNPNPPLELMTKEEADAGAECVRKPMASKVPPAKDARAKERELFEMMRRVKVWPIAPDREPDEKA